MRIKRFTAPDMRTALRMVRDEQGPDAVILSTRPRPDGAGIEVVAATDYDEALVAQALRAAAPAAPAEPPPAPAPAASEPAQRDGLISRARAALRLGDGLTLAELTARQAKAAAAASATRAAIPGAPVQAPAPTPSVQRDARAAGPTAQGRPPTPAGPPAQDAEPGRSRFDAMMAALDAAPRAQAPVAAPLDPALVEQAAQDGALLPPIARPVRPGADDIAAAPQAVREPARPDTAPVFDPAATAPPARAAPVSALDLDPAPATAFAPAPAAAPATAPVPATAPASAPAPAPAAEGAPVAPAAPARPLLAVPVAETDPAIVAMREEMARMRQLMETQMAQLSLERLRGSPARAAVLDSLLAWGCEDALAQAVAERIDPRLPPDQVQAPMLAELAAMLPVLRSEPLEDGGVIALVGPTGAGKTTTAAKLAARFAARHRARDVALVTTDCQRPGAREQLQAHGRRLGITVCEAEGPERLQDALAQLVDYPLVLVDTTGHAPRDRAVFSQILWLRASRRVRSLLVLPANAHPHDLGEVIRRYRPAKPEGVVLTKLDESGRPGAAFSVLAGHGLGLAYTSRGQDVPADIDAADATALVQSLEKSRRAADNPLATEDHHAVA